MFTSLFKLLLEQNCILKEMYGSHTYKSRVEYLIKWVIKCVNGKPGWSAQKFKQFRQIWKEIKFKLLTIATSIGGILRQLPHKIDYSLEELRFVSTLVKILGTKNVVQWLVHYGSLSSIIIFHKLDFHIKSEKNEEETYEWIYTIECFRKDLALERRTENDDL